MIRDAKCAWERQHLDISEHLILHKDSLCVPLALMQCLKCVVTPIISFDLHSILVGEAGKAFTQYLLSISYVPGTVLGTRSTEMKKTLLF